MRCDPGSALAALGELALADDPSLLQAALEAARAVVGMDVAYFSELTTTDQVILGVAGDSAPFGFEEGTATPLDETYCRRMLEGTIPPVIADAGQVPELASLPTSAMSGYVSVPLQLTSGRVYGTLCCASTEARPDLDERDLAFLRVVARLIADALDHPQPVGDPRAAAAEPAPPPVESGDGLARLVLWLVSTPKAVPAARRALDSLSDYCDEEGFHSLQLLVSELVTNAVRHTGLDATDSIGMEVAITESKVRVDITDRGPGFDPDAVPEPDPGTPGGWGLYLVETMAARWAVERDDARRNRVWFELDSP